MKISIFPGAYRDAPLSSHVLTLLDGLKQQGCAIDYTSISADATFAETVAACANADAVLTMPASPLSSRLEAISHASDLFASLHSIALPRALSHLSPVGSVVAGGLDVLIVGDRHCGLSGALPRGVVAGDRELIGTNTIRYAESDIRRLAHLAFDIARRRSSRLISVDQADHLETMELWRDVVSEVADEYPDVQLEHLLIEQALQQLVTAPHRFDTIVAGGSLATILAAQASVLSGLADVWPHALVGASTLGIYEIAAPRHDESIASVSLDAHALAALNALSLMFQLGPDDESLKTGIENAYAHASVAHRSTRV